MNVVRNVKRNILKGVLIANKLNRRKNRMSRYKINVAKQRYNEARERMLLSALDIVNKLKSGVSEEFKKYQLDFKAEARNYKKTIENHLKEELKKLNLSLTK